MSTSAVISIKDAEGEVRFYRHWDGDFTTTGEDLKAFVSLYTTGALRLDVMQSAGWLIVRGHFEYGKSSHLPSTKGMDGWKVGAYEPIYRDEGLNDYFYSIDLSTRQLYMHQNGTPDSTIIDF